MFSYKASLFTAGNDLNFQISATTPVFWALSAGGHGGCPGWWLQDPLWEICVSLGRAGPCKVPVPLLVVGLNASLLGTSIQNEEQGNQVPLCYAVGSGADSKGAAHPSREASTLSMKEDSGREGCKPKQQCFSRSPARQLFWSTRTQQGGCVTQCQSRWHWQIILQEAVILWQLRKASFAGWLLHDLYHFNLNENTLTAFIVILACHFAKCCVPWKKAFTSLWENIRPLCELLPNHSGRLTFAWTLEVSWESWSRQMGYAAA